MRDTAEEEADKPHKCHAAVSQSMATPASGGQDEEAQALIPR